MTQLVAAMVVWRAGFGRMVDASAINSFTAMLREGRLEPRLGDVAIQATVLHAAITARFTPRRRRLVASTAIVFRDELSPALWREVSVRLRYQLRPGPKTKLH